MKSRFAVWALASAALLAVGCGANKVLPPDRAVEPEGGLEAGSRPVAFRLEGAGEVVGEIGPGALYGLFRPERWNGDLVLYAHGIIHPAAPVALPTTNFTQELRDLLLQRGFAVGYSSYSENGYAVKDGIQRTQQLRGLFVSRLGRPNRTFVTGHSLGGLVALALAEQHPEHYAGALPMCGVMGGTRREFQYMANVRVLFDVFYGGVLRGSLMELPADIDIDRDVVRPAVAAMMADPRGAFAISQIDQTPVPFSSPAELVSSIVQALVLHVIELEDLKRRTHGHGFFENRNTVYTGRLPEPLLADVNARVARYRSTPDAEAFMERYYEPSGRLRIPVLALHTSWDPIVPFFHETVYRDLAAARGSSALLVQREERRYGHCGFTPEQMAAAVEELVAWSTTGARPAP